MPRGSRRAVGHRIEECLPFNGIFDLLQLLRQVEVIPADDAVLMSRLQASSISWSSFSACRNSRGQMKKAAANVGAMSIGICRSLGRWPMDGLSRQATWVWRIYPKRAAVNGAAISGKEFYELHKEATTPERLSSDSAKRMD